MATGRVVAYISNPIILMKLGMRGEGITGTESLGVHWYALNTKTKLEGLVAQQFERIGIECFFRCWMKNGSLIINQSSSLLLSFQGFVCSSEPHEAVPSAGLYERGSGASHIRTQQCSSWLHDT